MEKRDSLLGGLRILAKWRMQIIYICGAAALGSVIISLLLPIYYKSSTTFLAASPDRISVEAYFPSGSFKTYYYGTGEDIDRILTLAESSELTDFLIDSFNLYQHYDIDPNGLEASHKIQEKFSKLYNVKKDKRDAIIVSVEDQDQELAAAIANAARDRIDFLAMQMIRSSQKRELNTLENNIEQKEARLRVLGDTLQVLREKYGIYNMQAQTELLPAQYSSAEAKLTREQAKLEAMKTTQGIRKDTIRLTETRVEGIKKEVELLKNKLKLFNEGSAFVDILHKQYLEANQSLGDDVEHLKKLEATYNAEGSALILVEKAKVPVVKSWPKRSILVIGAVFVTFIFTVFGILLFETYQDVNWKEVLNAK